MSVIKNDKRAVQIIMSPWPEAEDAKKIHTALLDRFVRGSPDIH